ncbi:MAG: NAD(P)H-quinone oxidoreductase [Nitratireductor sp.]
MKFISIKEYGGPDVLHLSEGEKPKPKSGEVLIEVAYAGVNRPDCIQRAGHYPPPPGTSQILGLEVSGKIVELGTGVDANYLGKSVMALTPGGGYAQYCTVPVSHTLPIPSGLSLSQAAVVPETFFTVWHNVFEGGALKSGEVFLVHGGSSGIGTTAIQLAKAFGAFVITTAGSTKKCDACKALGADVAINYKQEDFVKVVKAVCKENFAGDDARRGPNVILDMVGGANIEKNYDVAALDARIVQIAFLEGAKHEVNFVKLMMKRLTHTGSTLRARSDAFKAQIAIALQEQVWPLIESQKVKPILYETFGLKDAAKAHTLMESNSHIGKIVLKVGG